MKLQPQPARLLVLLVNHAGELVTRDEIRDTVWGTETFVDFDQSVNFCVRQIRNALHDNADAPCYLETLPRRGYRFIAPVQCVSTEPPQAAIAMVPVARPGPRLWHRVAIATAVVVIAGTAGGRSVLRHSSTASSAAVSKVHEQVELGRFFLNRMSRADTLTALELFEAAARHDPQYAPAFAGLADGYNQLGGNFVAGRPPDNVRLLAMRAATRAIQLDPSLAEAHAALGYTTLHELDWTQADRSLRRAIELNPHYAPARQMYASYLVAQRRFASAIDEARRAVDLEPVSLRARHTFAWMLYFNRQYDHAIRELRTILQMDRTYAVAQWRLGQVLLLAGRYDEAVATLRAVADDTQRAPAVLGLLARAYGARGQRVEAQQIVAELEQRSATQRVPSGALAEGYLGIGDHSRAIDALEKVYADRDGFAIYINVDPLMDPLRKEPRFQEICRRLTLGTRSPTAFSTAQ